MLLLGSRSAGVFCICLAGWIKGLKIISMKMISIKDSLSFTKKEQPKLSLNLCGRDIKWNRSDFLSLWPSVQIGSFLSMLKIIDVCSKFSMMMKMEIFPFRSWKLRWGSQRNSLRICGWSLWKRLIKILMELSPMRNLPIWWKNLKILIMKDCSEIFRLRLQDERVDEFLMILYFIFNSLILD